MADETSMVWLTIFLLYALRGQTQGYVTEANSGYAQSRAGRRLRSRAAPVHLGTRHFRGRPPENQGDLG
jgi:hypothetical protein